jgi:hypothetical protein
MTRHLTERELIEYQFELGSSADNERISSHLSDCSQCSEHLESLKRKYSALELLREDVVVSENLISRTVEQASQPIKTRVISYHKAAWIGSAAAVLLIGSLFLVANLSRNRLDSSKQKGSEVAVGSKEFRPLGGDGLKGHATSLLQPGKGKLPGTVDDIAKAAIPDEPPFAPASAIELVVLPKRENVQLTIYNSTFRSVTLGAHNRDFPPAQQKKRGGYGGGTMGGMMGGMGGYGGYGSRGGYGQGGYGGRGGYNNRYINTSQAMLQTDGIQGSEGQAQQVAGGDLTLVRETRQLTLKRGWNWLQFMWANTLIDPTSLHLVPIQQKDKISVEQLVFPSRLRELGRWLIRSEVDGQVPFEITYFTTGITWRAFYMGTLSQDEKTMRLQSYVRVTNNSGEEYENAQTRLIVGNVHILDEVAALAQRPHAYGRPGGYKQNVNEPSRTKIPGSYGGDGGNGYHWTNDYAWNRMGGMGGGFGGGVFLGRPKEVTKEGLSEYFLYTIEGTETIPNKWSKRLRSFEVDDINVTSLYKYDEERYSNQTIRFISFANDEEHNLGDTPLPDGSVKIYGIADSDGLLSYVGTAGMKYIPVSEEIELNLGAARLVRVEPTLMEFKTENYLFDTDDNISGWDEIRTWDIKITNTRPLPVDIEIMRGFGTAYWSIASDTDYTKYDYQHARWKLMIEPRTKRTFSYTVRTYHGRRQEQANQ